MTKIIHTPLDEETVSSLMVGDRVLLCGAIYTARDAAHKRLVDMLGRGERLPIDLRDQTIYYVGPCPAKPGQAIGSAGPTTSGRMDAYTPELMDIGLRGMIGKGLRSRAVVDSLIKNKAVYFAAIGGAGALLAQAIKKAEVVAFDDLGAEAIFKLEVENFPATVAIDCVGSDLYEIGRNRYKRGL